MSDAERIRVELAFDGQQVLSVLVSLLLTVRTCVRSRAALHLEILALRHQLQVLNRSRPRRLQLAQPDRLLWVWLPSCPLRS